MKKLYPLGLLILICIMLPNCGRIIDWGKTNFYQGKEIEDFTTTVKPFIRSVTIYDQLETKAIFDVVWLNDEVRTAYARLHTMRKGKSEEKFSAFLRRQLEENNHFMTFYVVSTHEVKLGIPQSQWSFFLTIDGNEYQPSMVKEIELPYEYQLFFGNRWNRFKVPYVVSFNAIGEEGKPLLTDTTKSIILTVRSAQKEHNFVWHLFEGSEKSMLGSHVKRKRK